MEKGPNDLEYRIEYLTNQNDFLKGKLKKLTEKYNIMDVEFNRLLEENHNFKLVSKDDTCRHSKHIKGDQAELIAQEFFIKKGFYVF